MVFIVFFLLFSQLSLSLFNVSFASTDHQHTNPFTAKASLLRYWNSHVSNQLPPDFLFSKASPLSAVDAAVLASHAARGSLSSRFQSFCYSANLFCSFDSETEISVPRSKDADFKLYGNKNFVNYGGARLGGTDSFKNYSDGLNTADHSFKRYGGNSSNHKEGFTNYAEDGNVANSNFISYAAESNGGSGEFVNYDKLVNVPNLRFTAYDLDSKTHKLSFTSYGNETNSGSQSFTSYGKNGNGVPQEFSSYSDGSNILTSTFTGYGESGKTANDSFKEYGLSGNNPHTNFKNYGKGGNSEIDTFSNYRNGANVGDDSFLSYAKNSNSGRVNFANYGKSFNHGNDSFKEYGKGSIGRTTVGFKSYSVDRNFTTYAQKGVSFSEYSNFTTATGSGIHVNKRVEPGKFFREYELKQGNVMVMPDIRDKMPPRSFLPRSILVNLPFSSSRISEAKEIFHARDGSTMERVITNALAECERAPSRGETKRCVGSAEDMIDFATAVLGRSVVARTTASVNGSREKVEIGRVKGINGGDLTRSVSCHQSLYPYLLYYCHSVPKVRIYEADILRLKTKEKINRGVAICHMDTSSWGPEHGAFVALGQKPGSATFPFFGVQPVLVDEKGNEIEGGCSGYLCLKSSWPSAFRTLYNDQERYETTYFKPFPGYYFSGDGCTRDKDGYYWLTGRVDDVINVSGHRIGTAEVESALVSHPQCAEAAVVGVEHEVKGQGIYAFVTLVDGVSYSEELRKSLILTVRKQIGAFAAPDKIHWAPGLPKTRSGKIMRRILRKIASKQLDELGDTSTLADPGVVDQLIKLADC